MARLRENAVGDVTTVDLAMVVISSVSETPEAESISASKVEGEGSVSMSEVVLANGPIGV